MAVLADRIKELRLSKQMTQTEFGNVFGIVKSTISLYESGKSTPNDQIKTQICEYFNVSMDFLHGLSDEKSLTESNSFASSEDCQKSLYYWISKTGHGYDEIAKMLGISERQLENYCSGKDIPLEKLSTLSKICGISTDCLLGLRESSRPERDGVMPFQFDPEISRRLKDQAKQMDESYGFIADVLGIEENEVFNFFEHGFVPHLEVFVKIVEHFVVSSDYLLNRTGSTMTVQAEEERLLKAYRALSEDSQTIALSELLKLGREEALVAAKDQLLLGKSYPLSGTEG